MERYEIRRTLAVKIGYDEGANEAPVGRET